MFMLKWAFNKIKKKKLTWNNFKIGFELDSMHLT